MIHSPLIHQNAQALQGICAPIFRSAGLNYFDYIRLYDDGTFFALASDSAWSEHFLARKFPIVSNALKSGMYLWRGGEECSYFAHDARNYYNHDHGITIIRRFTDYYESFSFAAPNKNNNAINFYLNNMDQLEKFVWYFKEQTAHLSQTDDRKNRRLSASTSSIARTGYIFDGAKNINRIKINRYILNPNNSNNRLTKREMECYTCLLTGKTAGETAASLGISSKTVEGYVNTIKQKLNCSKRSQLFTKAVALGLISEPYISP